MFAGQEGDGREDILYLGINTYWEHTEIRLPQLPGDIAGYRLSTLPEERLR